MKLQNDKFCQIFISPLCCNIMEDKTILKKCEWSYVDLYVTSV